NAKTTHFFKITLLLCLVIAISFCILLAVIMYISYRHKRGLETLAYVDPITGGNTAQSFYMLADGLLSASNSPQYALVYTNIAKFKVLNEQLGRAACDTILRTASNSIQKTLSSKECSGRLFADNFCVLIEYKGEENLKERMLSWGSNYNAAWREFGTSWLPLSIEMGIYVVEDTAMSLPAMVDRAKLALHEPMSELDTQLHYTIYDERMRRRLLREKQLEDMMAIALEKHEFQVYLQPKYCTGNKNIGGAEALVRWSSASEGMIYPDEFISLFERNGFIVRLDLWVFEQVCKTLASWLSDGRTPMRISVNCSRIHLKTPGFLEQYRAILEKYAIPPNLLEIELTENVVFEDVVHLTKTIAEI
ncbi:MAG: EAL domain-containing protein, partial [Clostridia bacterium]